MRLWQRLNKLLCLVPGLVHPRCSGSPLSLFPFFAASPTAPSTGLHPHEVLSSRLLASRTETIFQKMIGCPSPHCAVGPVFRTTSPHLSPAQLPFSNLCTMFRIFFMPLCNWGRPQFPLRFTQCPALHDKSYGSDDNDKDGGGDSGDGGGSS